ncbi:hypothetical protein GGF32_003688 [Allomyces javanicus]|nr:hypothetical protein GGF32_003688 [Allomyces javanicus]
MDRVWNHLSLPGFSMCRQTGGKYAVQAAEARKVFLCAMFAKNNARITLTMDGWHATVQRRGYLVVTTSRARRRPTFATLEAVIHDYQIPKKILGVVTDNPDTNAAAVRALHARLTANDAATFVMPHQNYERVHEYYRRFVTASKSWGKRCPPPPLSVLEESYVTLAIKTLATLEQFTMILQAPDVGANVLAGFAGIRMDMRHSFGCGVHFVAPTRDESAGSSAHANAATDDPDPEPECLVLVAINLKIAAEGADARLEPVGPDQGRDDDDAAATPTRAPPAGTGRARDPIVAQQAAVAGLSGADVFKYAATVDKCMEKLTDKWLKYWDKWKLDGLARMFRRAGFMESENRTFVDYVKSRVEGKGS